MHYLGYYLKWHPQSCYYYAVEHGGFQASPERTPGTYSKYNSIDDRIDDFHYYTTVHQVRHRPRDLRRGAGDPLAATSRARKAWRWCKRFDGEFPERFAEEIFRYLSIPEKEFPEASQDVRAADHGPRSTSCISPTVSARRTCGSSKAASGNCATPSWQRHAGRQGLRASSIDGERSPHRPARHQGARTSSRACTSRACA